MTPTSPKTFNANELAAEHEAAQIIIGETTYHPQRLTPPARRDLKAAIGRLRRTSRRTAAKQDKLAELEDMPLDDDVEAAIEELEAEIAELEEDAERHSREMLAAQLVDAHGNHPSQEEIDEKVTPAVQQAMFLFLQGLVGDQEEDPQKPTPSATTGS